MSLILSRHIGQTIMIGDDVSVVVLGINGNQVRLGIVAPLSIEVHREEIYEKIQAEKLAKAPAKREGFLATAIKKFAS